MTMPQGAKDVRDLIVDFLATQFPPMIDAAREQWDLPDYMLPYPVKYDLHEPLTMEDYPSVGGIVTASRNMSRWDIDADDASLYYDVQYDCKVFLWARTPKDANGRWVRPEYQSAIELRDRLMYLMRMLVLNTPMLGHPRVVSDERSFNEDYLEPIRTNEQTPQWMCGGTLAMTLTKTEQTYMPAVGQADTISVDAYVRSGDLEA